MGMRFMLKRDSYAEIDKCIPTTDNDKNDDDLFRVRFHNGENDTLDRLHYHPKTIAEAVNSNLWVITYIPPPLPKEHFDEGLFAL